MEISQPSYACNTNFLCAKLIVFANTDHLSGEVRIHDDQSAQLVAFTNIKRKQVMCEWMKLITHGDIDIKRKMIHYSKDQLRTTTSIHSPLYPSVTSLAHCEQRHEKCQVVTNITRFGIALFVSADRAHLHTGLLSQFRWIQTRCRPPSLHNTLSHSDKR